jgi:hypothetical protein
LRAARPRLISSATHPSSTTAHRPGCRSGNKYRRHACTEPRAANVKPISCLFAGRNPAPHRQERAKGGTAKKHVSKANAARGRRLPVSGDHRNAGPAPRGAQPDGERSAGPRQRVRGGLDGRSGARADRLGQAGSLAKPRHSPQHPHNGCLVHCRATIEPVLRSNSRVAFSTGGGADPVSCPRTAAITRFTWLSASAVVASRVA